MKILVLSKYSRKGASSRFRFFQYYPFLQQNGFELQTEALFDDDYIHRLYSGKSRLLTVIKSYLRRFFVILHAKDFDVIWVEKELFPWVPWGLEKWFFRILSTPYVVDYDDAIFHQYDTHRFKLVRKLLGNKCDFVMKFSDVVVAGNDYLASRAHSSGAKKVEKIPTVVSSNTYTSKSAGNLVPVIGWIGSMSTAKYLEKLRPVLKKLSESYKFKFRIVGATMVWPDVPLECIPWKESEEVENIQSFDIGVMPLKDSPWEKGKCGFKLIQYMACGKPVVADAVGVNPEIVEDRVTGYLIFEDLKWEQALGSLLSNPELRQKMGQAGNKRFEKMYSLEANQASLIRIFLEAAKVKSGS